MAPIDVVVRTRNRPQLLAEALESVRLQLHQPHKVIVVNDGGVPVDEVCALAGQGLDLQRVRLDPARGRSAAAQAGLEHASASHVVFLDDDDRLMPEHLLVVARAVASGVTVPYTDAVQGVWRTSADGQPVPVARHRTLTGEFDPVRQALVNHIPPPCVAIPRELALAVGGFEPQVDLYEDWDLLLRLGRRTPFVHLERVTVEYRIKVGGDGITGANPPGSSGQLAALESIWRRHGLLDDPRRLAAGVMALVAERDRADEELLEERGRRDGLEAELHRVRARTQGLEEELDRLGARLVDVEAGRSRAEQLCAELEAAGVERANAAAERQKASRGIHPWPLEAGAPSQLIHPRGRRDRFHRSVNLMTPPCETAGPLTSPLLLPRAFPHAQLLPIPMQRGGPGACNATAGQAARGPHSATTSPGDDG